MRMAASSWTFFRNVIALSLAHSLHVIRHLAANLSQRQSIGSACGSPNVHASSRQFHKAENDQTGQTGSVRRSHREEFGGHDLLPMSLEELFPGRLPRSFRRWLDAVPFQNVPDRVVPDRDPGWPMLPVSVDSPRSDSPQPCGQPKQQFPYALDADREFDTDSQRGFRQSIFGATSTEFPARRWSPLDPVVFKNSNHAASR